LTKRDKFFKSDTSDTQKDGDRYHFYGIKDVCKPWKNTCKGGSFTCLSSGTGIAVDPINESDLIDVTDKEVDSDKECSDNKNSCEKASDCSGNTGVTCQTNVDSKECSNAKSLCEKDSDCYQVTCDPVNSDFEVYLSAARSCDKAGWMYEFPKAGERSFSKPVVFGSKAIWNTYLPSKEVCKASGESFIYAVNFETGTATDYEVFVEDAKSDPYHIDRRKLSGEGLPSDITLVKGKNKVMAFSQSSTGEALDEELSLDDALSSEFIGWKEESIPFDILENED